MIHYNKDSHHNEIVMAIAHSILTGIELDMPYQLPRNDGNPSSVVLTTEEETYAINPKDFLQLKLEAYGYAYKKAKLIVQEYEDIIDTIEKGNYMIGQDTLEKHWNKLYGNIIPQQESPK